MRGVSRAIDPAGTTCALLRGMRRAVARLVVDAGKYFKPFDETSRCALLARDRGGAAVARAHTWPPVQSVPPKQRGLCSARYNSQQFDGSLNLNVHFHVVLLDRGFAKNHHGKLAFHPPQAPWQTEIADVRWRVKKLLQRRGLLHNKPGDAENGAQSALDAGRHVPQRALIKALASCTRRDRRTSNGPRRRYGRSNANARRKFPPITSRIRSLLPPARKLLSHRVDDVLHVLDHPAIVRGIVPPVFAIVEHSRRRGTRRRNRWHRAVAHCGRVVGWVCAAARALRWPRSESSPRTLGIATK